MDTRRNMDPIDKLERLDTVVGRIVLGKYLAAGLLQELHGWCNRIVNSSSTNAQKGVSDIRIFDRHRLHDLEIPGIVW